MCLVYEGIKCLVEFIKKTLSEHFDLLSEKNLQICLYRRLDEDAREGEKKYNWECLYNEGIDEKELQSVFSKYSSGEILAENMRNIAGKYLVWAKECEGVMDSRLETSGTVGCLTWLFFTETKNEALGRILKISLCELIEKIEDMLLLEKMVPFLNRDVTGVENIWNYFFPTLLDKERIVNQYCRELLKENNLPDWMILIQISAMFYEKRVVKTNIYFSTDSVSRGNMRVKFQEPITVNITNLRTLRKLMEMAGSGHGLAAVRANQVMKIIGIVREDEIEKSIASIEFVDHMVWRIKRGDTNLFEYRKGLCRIPLLEQFGDSKKQLAEVEGWLARHGAKGGMNAVVGLINVIVKNSSHGAAVVFMKENILAKETERLQLLGKAYIIEPCNYRSVGKEIAGFTAIDGAILADMKGRCRAAGAILDGQSLIKGNPGRGSRYNSVSNYIHVVKKKYGSEDIFAVIISEDGMINVRFLHDDQAMEGID